MLIERIYAFVVVDDDGTEGIPAMAGPNGMWMPLVGADVKRMVSLRAVAQEMATRSGRPLRLVVFESRVELEVLTP